MVKRNLRYRKIKRNKGAVLSFEVPVFGWHIHLYTDQASFKKGVGDTDEIESYDSLRGVTSHNLNNPACIHIGIFEKSHGVITHECIHAVVMGMKTAGIPVSAENDEVLCYLSGWLVDIITDKMLDDHRREESETVTEKED